MSCSSSTGSTKTVDLGARHPRNREDWPLVGIFAQRAEARPNRLGVRRVNSCRSTISHRRSGPTAGDPSLGIDCRCHAGVVAPIMA